jgi:hypothetical protein
MREVGALQCQSEQERSKEQYTSPLHLSCGACAYCAGTCGDASCLECDCKLTSLVDSNSTTSCGSDSVHFYTMCEIQRHNTEKSAWLVAGDDIYDATDYVNQHPGGKTSILKKTGGACDCTVDFRFHSKSGRRVWHKYHVGKVKRCPGPHGNGHSDRKWWMVWL